MVVHETSWGHEVDSFFSTKEEEKCRMKRPGDVRLIIIIIIITIHNDYYMGHESQINHHHH